MSGGRCGGGAKKIAASFLDQLPPGSKLVCFVATDYEPNPAHAEKPHKEPPMRRKFSTVARLSVPNKKTITCRLSLAHGQNESDQLRDVCRYAIKTYFNSLPKEAQPTTAATQSDPNMTSTLQNKLLADTIVGFILANHSTTAEPEPPTEEEELEALLLAQEKALVKMTKKAAKQKEAASSSTGDKQIQ